MKLKQKLVLFLLLLKFTVVNCILLGKEEGEYLRDVLKGFECVPENGRYDRIIAAPYRQAALIPKIFIWCPLRHYGLTVLCPVHGCPLKVGRWTDLPDTTNANPRNPRLIYDISGNVILVQAFYECSESLLDKAMFGHRYLSASKEVLSVLPEHVAKEFPIIMQQRCGFTLRLYDYLITGIYQGQNFMELSEGIASLNYREYMRNTRNITETTVDVLSSSPFISYPSNDKLMDLFLMQFERNKELYENNMMKLTGKVISFDHTFRTSKHVGVIREDGKFVGQFQNLFIGVNENGEVLTWRFTKTTSFLEIIDMLKELKSRHDRAGKKVQMIIVDDCCHTMNLYEQTFPGVKLRLDLFHACMRVIQTVPKSEAYCNQFANEFSLIFRQEGDLGCERTKNTACADEIESNLERLLFAWRGKLKKETLDQIENLRKHIRKGCLSDIPVGCGTEINERLHRHINRSLLCGVSKIGPELAVAVMACALYAWNCKRRLKRLLNKRTIPVAPIELEALQTQTPIIQSHMTAVGSLSTPPCADLGTATEMEIQPSTQSVFAKANSVEELKQEPISNYILQRVLHIQDFINSWTAQCNNKTVDLIDLLWSINLSALDLCEHESKLNTTELDLTAQHKDNLIRNLSGFNLQLDPIEKDGNCFFRATARQLNKLLQRSDLLNDQRQHISSLELGINEESDTRNLRLLFIREVTQNIDEYREWMSSPSFASDIERFQNDGHFASEIGDICAKACANLLRVPIVLITALPTVASIPFLPKYFTGSTPVYLAYDHSGPGHYDATKESLNLTDDSEERDTVKILCTCGKNVKDPSKIACITSKCPCNRKSQECSRRCRCYNCKNISNKEAEKPSAEKRKKSVGCKCGNTITKSDTTRVSCKDGERKTRCPCVAEGTGCTVNCKCKNCGNIFQTGGVSASLNKGKKRRRETVSSYKRKPGIEFMASENASVTYGPWSILETVCLVVCKELLMLNALTVNSLNLSTLYNFVAESDKVKELSFIIARKTTAQVAAKMSFQSKHGKH